MASVSSPRMRAPHPTYQQLEALPAYVQQPVPVAFEDVNGHLNVRHYTGIASEGLDESHERLSFVLEEVFLHIDMETRRTAPWPEDVAAALDRRIARDADLPWEPDVSGSMSLR